MNKRIKTLIVDDEPLARERIRMLLESDESIEIAGEFGDGASAVTGIQTGRPDLLFLDVQMPEVDGFEVLSALDADQVPVTIFVTAYDQYAIRAFDVCAVDYLLKPFDRSRFLKALGRARKQIELNASTAGAQSDLSTRLLGLLEQARPDTYLQRFVIKSGGRVSFVKVDEVDWVEAAGNYVRLHAGRETHMLRETMSALEQELDPRKFVRIHRGTAVNVERIKELRPLFHGDHEVTLADGVRLTLSRSYLKNLERALGRSL